MKTPPTELARKAAYRQVNRARLAEAQREYYVANRESDNALARAYRDVGVPCHVDHVVPLRGRGVTGLHVQTNLTVLPTRDNLSKGNRVWPDMPT